MTVTSCSTLSGAACPVSVLNPQPMWIAVGPQQGRKAFMIRTIRPLDRPDPGLERVAKANGFSLHAGVSCEGHLKDKRERLCRYIARPAVAVRLAAKGSSSPAII